MNEEVGELGGRHDLFAAALNSIHDFVQEFFHFGVIVYTIDDLLEIIYKYKKYVWLTHKRVQGVSELVGNGCVYEGEELLLSIYLIKHHFRGDINDL